MRNITKRQVYCLNLTNKPAVWLFRWFSALLKAINKFDLHRVESYISWLSFAVYLVLISLALYCLLLFDIV